MQKHNARTKANSRFFFAIANAVAVAPDLTVELHSFLCWPLLLRAR